MKLRASRVLLAAVFSACALRGGGRPPLGGEQVLVVTSSGIAAYEEILEGLRHGISARLVYVLDLRQDDAAALLTDLLRAKSIRVVVTIGAEAAEAVVPHRGALPLIATGIAPGLLPKEPTARAPTVAVIPVHVPLATLLENVKRVFPMKTRLGIIYNPAVPEAGLETLKNAAEAAGFQPSIAECAGPAQLLQILQALQQQVDLVLCFPDSTLYNSATIKPLVLASLRYRLPLIGFSESFVRAGAALGIYPSFREIGAQSAELAHKTLSGRAVSRTETPRKFTVAVNQNITRLLGLAYSQPGPAREFVVLR